MGKTERFCGNCKFGIPVSINGDILCKLRGAVSPNYCCSKHRFESKVKIFRPKCIECEYFILTDDIKESKLGLCKLFSVRKYDGNQKNTCSRFVEKYRQNCEIS